MYVPLDWSICLDFDISLAAFRSLIICRSIFHDNQVQQRVKRTDTRRLNRFFTENDTVIEKFLNLFEILDAQPED